MDYLLYHLLKLLLNLLFGILGIVQLNLLHQNLSEVVLDLRPQLPLRFEFELRLVVLKQGLHLKANLVFRSILVQNDCVVCEVFPAWLLLLALRRFGGNFDLNFLAVVSSVV